MDLEVKILSILLICFYRYFTVNNIYLMKFISNNFNIALKNIFSIKLNIRIKRKQDIF